MNAVIVKPHSPGLLFRFTKCSELIPSWGVQFWWRRAAFTEPLSRHQGCRQQRIIVQENWAEDFWGSFLLWVFIQQLLPLYWVPKYHLWKQKPKSSDWSNRHGLWAMGVKSQLLDSTCFHSPGVIANFFSLPWSFLKMRPNPMLQTYQCFFPKCVADLPSFFSPHRECAFSVKVGFYKATPDFAVPEAGWSPLTKEIPGHQHN